MINFNAMVLCYHQIANILFLMTQLNAEKVNLHVSKRLHLRRALLGMSTKTLGQSLGLSHQKLSSCEGGRSIISAGLLFELGKALNVPVTYFYEGLYKNDPLEIALHQLSELPPAFFKDNFFIQPENFEH